MRTTFEADSSRWPSLWRDAYKVLEQNIVSTQLRVWIQPLELSRIEERSGSLAVYMSAPNDFCAKWVRDYHMRDIQSAFVQVTGTSCEIILSASPDANNTPVRELEETASSSGNAPARNIPAYYPSSSASGNQTKSAKDPALGSQYPFNNFIVGASNRFAYAAAVAVAEQPGKQYNPLFIYSNPGLGKTHLLHAIGNQIIARAPELRVLYLSAEMFANDLIVSLMNKRMPDFRAKYRDGFDVILMDDIHFLAGKETTEEEFFHTFNTLHAAHKHIVVTSDKPPKEIANLEERIRTRFEWGLVANIDYPEIETRIAILKAKAERDDIYLPDEVASFIATHIKSNIRELEGALVKLQAYSSLTGAEISLEMATQELRSAIPEESSHITVETIQAAVAKNFGIRVNDLKSSNRTKRVAAPRQIAMYLIRKYTGLGFFDIGQYFGGKDHTTVMYACNKIEEELETKRDIRESVEAIQNQL